MTSSLSSHQIASEVCTVMLLKEGSIPAALLVENHEQGHKNNEFVISTDGYPGENGQMARDSMVIPIPSTVGVTGQAGQDGQHGEDALDIILGITINPATDCYSINHFHYTAGTVTCHEFPMNPIQPCGVVLSAKGGDGGNGGTGGKGGPGGVGKDGSPAQPKVRGTNGANGAFGGVGGNGGNGGNAGRNGDARIYFKQEDLDLLSTIVKIENNISAIPGKGGRPGYGGPGGSGGKGGIPFIVESHDSEGGTHSTIVSPGGKDGHRGHDGDTGDRGHDGLPAQPGNITYWMLTPSLKPGLPPQLMEVRTMYQLQLLGLTLEGMISNIFEPFLCLKLLNLEVMNNGDLLSPMRLVFDVEMTQPGCIRTLSSAKASNMIEPHSSAVISNESLSLTLLEQPFVGFNNSLCIDTTLRVQAITPRTAMTLPGFHQAGYQLRIEYPIELTPVIGSHALPLEGRLPIALKLHNKANLAIGHAAPAPYNRPVRIVIELLSKNDGVQLPGIQFELLSDANASVSSTDSGRNKRLKLTTSSTNPTLERFVLNKQPVVLDIACLPANSEWLLGGVVSLLPPYHPEIAYSSLAISFALLLQDPSTPDTKDKQSSPPRLIQREVHTIQLAELCAIQTFPSSISYAQVPEKVAPPSPISSALSISVPIFPVIESKHVVVLVINSEVSRKEIHYWKSLVSSLGGCYDILVWNLSLYHGVSYDMIECNFRQLAQDSLVIFLNTHYHVPSMEGLQLPIHCLESHEIFVAARCYGVRTFVVNTGSDPTEMSQRLYDVQQRCKPQVKPQQTTSVSLSSDHLLRNVVKAARYVYNEHIPNIVEGSRTTIQMSKEPTVADCHTHYQSFIQSLSETRPDHSYYVYSQMHLKPVTVTKSGCLSFGTMHELGTIDVRRGLDMTYATVACKTRYEQDIVQLQDSIFDIDHPNNDTLNGNDGPMLDLFMILKLLPFDRKLLILDQLASVTQVTSRTTLVQRIVLQAILSDLVDEQFVYVNAVKKPAGTMSELLLMLKYLASYSFRHVTLETTAGTGLRDVLISIAALVQCYPKQWCIFEHFLVQPSHYYLLQCMQRISGSLMITRRSYVRYWKEVWVKSNVTPTNQSAMLQQWLLAYRDPYQAIASGRVWSNNWSLSTSQMEIVPSKEDAKVSPAMVDHKLNEYFLQGQSLIQSVEKKSRDCKLRHTCTGCTVDTNTLLKYVSSTAVERNDSSKFDDIRISVSGLS